MNKIIVAFFGLILSFGASAQMFGYGYPTFGGYNEQQREIGAGQYGQNNALRGSNESVFVEIVAVRNVKIQPKASGMAQAAGAGVGGIAGAALATAVGKGGSNERNIAMALLGAGGALIGNMVAQPSAVDAQEVTFRKVGGERMVTVVQAQSNLRPGMRALATDIGGEIRLSVVEPAQQSPVAANSVLSGL